MNFYKTIFTICILMLCLPLQGQKKRKKNSDPPINQTAYNALEWRNIGPFRGGRSVGSSGVVGHPSTFYMGSTGGGVWKTTDNGQHWNNISDGFFKTGTVGALAVSESDPNVVVVGMGEHAARGVMTSMGDGVYKSNDAGATWSHIGLDYSRHIANIEIHPTNPDIFYVAVQGAQFAPSKERGIYKTVDGGATWEKVLYVNETTGAASLSMDRNNPRILYAALWEHERKPWQMQSGEKHSGLYKSTDGGTNWTKMTEGLPEVMGKAGISVSQANANIVYANLEAKGDKGGVYRSDDGGEKWKQVNKDRVTVARSWYYMEVFADPVDENVVYVLNAPVLKSIDKGKTFEPLPTPHGDNHHLWINPNNNQIMINSNDGGANVSINGGKSWSTQENQPTSQFYRVIADAQVPYHVYGGQQDNSAIGIKSRTNDAGIDWKDWYSVAGCESAFLAFDPKNPQTVFGGCYQGIIERWDRVTRESKGIKAYPELGLSIEPKDFKYRYNWNAPIISSPQDPTVIYHAGNVVFKTVNGGTDWEVISPDLTRNEKSKQGPGGVPFTNEAAGGENYNTLMSLVASPHDENVLWAGSDDGLVHITQNGGASWENVTPKGLPEGIVNSIEVSPFDPATAYIVVMRYKVMDLNPYVFKTNDYGVSWTSIVDGLEGVHNFPRVVRADKKVPGLLYAGTETGLYISKNDGANWSALQLNLPVVPINDLYIQDNDLIAATAGRSFWILDDLTPIQFSEGVKELKILTPKDTYRIVGGQSRNPDATLGQNPKAGVLLDYYLPETPDSLEVRLEIFENENLIRTYSSKKQEKKKSWPGGPSLQKPIPAEKGFNRFHWDLRREELPSVEKVFVYGGYSGAMVAPGTYTAKISYGDKSSETKLTLLADPNIKASPSDYQEQQEVLESITSAIHDIHASVNTMRLVQSQLDHHFKTLGDDAAYADLVTLGKTISERLKTWEEALIQPNQKTFQDVINFNNKLNAQFNHLKEFVGSADPVVTGGAKQRLADLQEEWKSHRAVLKEIIEKDMEAFNQMYKELNISPLMIAADAVVK